MVDKDDAAASIAALQARSDYFRSKNAELESTMRSRDEHIDSLQSKLETTHTLLQRALDNEHAATNEALRIARELGTIRNRCLHLEAELGSTKDEASKLRAAAHSGYAARRVAQHLVSSKANEDTRCGVVRIWCARR
jgi:chromosome segregation ATPase